MTSLQLNVVFFQGQSTVATDGSMMKEATKALGKIIANHDEAAMDETEHLTFFACDGGDSGGKGKVS